MNPSRKIDELARRVLRAARWAEQSPSSSPTNDDASPTPHLDELERALEIRLPPLAAAATTTNSGEGDAMECTVPNGMSKVGDDDDDVWTWTPRTNTANNSYSVDCDGRTLEEMAPFSPAFYRALGELTREAFHPGSVGHLKKEKANTTSAAAAAVASDGEARHRRARNFPRSTTTTTRHEALRSLERYSLPRSMDAARIARILMSLQELNVAGRDDAAERGEDGDNRVSFVEYLLHYCEGMVVRRTDPRGGPTTIEDGGIVASTSDDRGVDRSATKRGQRIPVLSALFHHWGNLPRSERGLRRLARKYAALLPTDAEEYREYCISSSSGTTVRGSVGDGGSTGGEWKPPSSAAATKTSFLGDRALRIESFRMRMEDELNRHINGGGGDDIKLGRGGSPERGGLVELLTTFYRSSDSTLRGKCRRWMGQWLRSFALGSGSSTAGGGGGGSADGSSSAGVDDGLGPSFASFCPMVAATTSLATSSDASAGIVGGGGGTATVAVSVARTGGGGGGGSPHDPLGMEDTSACGVEALLQVLLRIIAGFTSPLPPSSNAEDGAGVRSGTLRRSHERLLFDVIVPLHRPSGMVLWRDQTPLIGLYHEALVKAIGAFVSMDRTLAGPIIGALLRPDVWPGTEGGNTPKVVLLLHEVDTLIGMQSQTEDSGDRDASFLASFDTCIIPLVSRLCSCISCENSRISERALQFFRNKAFKTLVKRRLLSVAPLFLRALCRCPSREVPWNPTVRKMTLMVMQELEGFYEQMPSGGDEKNLFCTACEEALTGVDLSNVIQTSDKVIKSSKGTVKLDTHSGDSLSISGSMTSLRGAMGSWKPPPQKGRVLPSSKGGKSRQPPSNMTAVAPWALGGQNHGIKSKSKFPRQKQPPLTVTGVAPWAVNKQLHGLPSPPTARKTSSNGLPRPAKKHVSGLPVSGSADAGIADAVEESEVHYQNGNVQTRRTALDEVRTYMEKLKTEGDDAKNSDGISSWAKAQMEASPVLLPSLKFHDLVFGKDLGSGAFSTVRYARRIVKTLTRSNWPEYAVKIVSTQKIEELGYEQSINREIAILQTLAHPGISRLVSSFRFRDGAYLILEYASGGDLHSLLRKNGSLDHESTRFVIGSVAAALYSIHERGFVYADCKPENILITETGHIKVADFGGCRPVTTEAKDLVKESSVDLLKKLRDGDWKTNPASSFDTNVTGEIGDDLRIEGTTAYLPPEVVIGGFPTTAADIWALGCVLFQCISGRPPILEDTDDLTAQKIVSFNLRSDKQNFFGEYGVTFRADAKALIETMLHCDFLCRPNVLQIADDDFFDGIDIFSLHKNPAHPLDVGSIAPKSDAKWSRRQFSSIWAPQPRAYNIGAASTTLLKSSSSQDRPIGEGDEAEEEFLPKQKAPLLTKIRE